MDGLEVEFAGRLTVLRVNIYTAAGRELGSKYAARATPTFVLLDGAGAELYRQFGTIDAEAIRARITD